MSSWKDLNFMKTFESEYEELKKWLFERTEIYFEKREKEKPKGHDSKAEYKRAQDIQEYNRRLIALKKKYGKETAPHTDAEKVRVQ